MSDKKQTETLAQKLVKVMSSLDDIPKRGYNDFHKYHFAREADVMQAVRTALSEHRIMILPSIAETLTQTKESNSGKTQFLTHVKMLYKIIDADSGETMELNWQGSGIDTEEKGLYKGLTGCHKTFFMKLFCLGSDDDPETTDAHKGGGAPAPAAVAPQGAQRRSQQADKDRPFSTYAYRYDFRNAGWSHKKQLNEVCKSKPRGEMVWCTDKEHVHAWCWFSDNSYDELASFRIEQLDDGGKSGHESMRGSQSQGGFSFDDDDDIPF